MEQFFNFTCEKKHDRIEKKDKTHDKRNHQDAAK